MATWLNFDQDEWVKDRIKSLMARAMTHAAAEARALKEACPPSIIYARGGLPAPKNDGDIVTIAKAEAKRDSKRTTRLARAA